MLVVFKSAPILKRVLKVKHEVLQLYVLKVSIVLFHEKYEIGIWIFLRIVLLLTNIDGSTSSNRKKRRREASQRNKVKHCLIHVEDLRSPKPFPSPSLPVSDFSCFFFFLTLLWPLNSCNDRIGLYYSIWSICNFICLEIYLPLFRI